MKKLIFIFLVFVVVQANSQTKDTSWTTGGIATLNFNQTTLTNWAAGGENSVAATALLNIYANYRKNRVALDNSLDLAYGLIKPGDADIRKNEDKIDFLSKFGYDATNKNKWFYSALFNFKSQFVEGFNYPNDSVAISKFAAPAYVLLALGMDYKPNKDFSLFISPLTAKMTFVNDQDLADAGAYGVDKAEYEIDVVTSTSTKTKDGEKFRGEFGAYLNAKYQKDVVTNVNLLTKLDLFSNYANNPQNIDVNWEVLIAMKINKFLTASISTQLIYDHDINIPEFKTENGVKVPKLRDDGVTAVVGPRTQFKEVIGIGLAYKF